MSKNEKFSAVITLAAELGGSVKSVFGTAKKETEKLGAAVKQLHAKRDKVTEAKSQEQSVKDAEAVLNRALLRQRKAEQAASKMPWDKEAQKQAQRLARETAKATTALDKEYKALAKTDAALKKSGVAAKDLASEEKKLGDAIEKTEKKMQSRERFTSVAHGFKTLGLAATAAASAVVGGMFLIDKSMGENAKSIVNKSKALGISTDYVQGLRMLGVEVGLTYDKTDLIVSRTVKNIDDALRAGKGKTWDYMARLGLDPKKLRGKGVTNAIDEVLEALRRYKGADKGELMNGIGGRGAMLFAAIDGGRAALHEEIEHGKETGKVMGDTTIKKADDFERSMLRFKMSIDGVKNSIGEATLKPFTKFFDEITQSIEANAPEIKKWSRDVGDALDKFVDSGNGKRMVDDIGKSIGFALSSMVSLITKFGEANAALDRFADRWNGVEISRPVPKAERDRLFLERKRKELENTPYDKLPLDRKREKLEDIKRQLGEKAFNLKSPGFVWFREGRQATLNAQWEELARAEKALDAEEATAKQAREIKSGPVVNNPVFNFNVSPVPGMDPNEIGRKIAEQVSRIFNQPMPALAGGYQHD